MKAIFIHKVLTKKNLERIVRIWMSYVLISNAGVGTLIPLRDLGLPDHIFQIIQGMWDTGFMMEMVKLTELVAGVALLFNCYVPLILMALIPVVLNIYGMHVFLFHSYITQGLALVLACAFLVYQHREKYKPLTALR
ncbi:MAG: hypothetical protein K2P81_01765 [Bacteriovoracaceae bacterium]|nr:hypothetical protein [Bacteriovoracaceae bacterium]